MAEDQKKPESLTVMPVSGKYCEIVFDNRSYKIWKVRPGTPDSFGTPIPYDVAIYFLGKVPPIITLVPLIKEGRTVSPILPEDQKAIQANLAAGFTGGYKNYNAVADNAIASSGKDGDALVKALGLLEKQAGENKALQESLARATEAQAALLARMEKLEKAGKAPAAPPVVPATPAQ
jgi:hypothetical protein